MNARLARTITPERRFLLACARLRTDQDAVARAAAGVGSWERVLEEAERHHLAPLVARACEDADVVPEHVLERLRELRQMSTVRNTIYLHDAREALQAFAESGITPVVLKGVALAESIYGDIGLRPFCDLDVLLDVAEMDAAERALERLGYRAEPSPHDRAWYFENYYQLPRYSRRRNGFCIELHWDLGRRPYPFHLDVPAMRERAVPIVAAGVPALRFDTEDIILHLAVHLAWGNGFDGHVRGLVDIAEVVRHGVDWRLFEQRALESNCAQVAAPALELAAWLLDAPVPAHVLEALKKRRGSALSQMIARVGQASVLEGGEGHRTWMRLFWLERFRDRIQLLKENFGGEGAMSRVGGGVRRALVPFLPRRGVR